MYIMIDGIDGSGKTTIVRSWSDWLTSHGRRVFDAIAFEKMHGCIPNLVDVGEADVVISGEPTYAGIGLDLRQNLLHPESGATPQQVAEAFSAQRAELYNELIIPALQKNLLVIQDRGITTSLCYQPTMSPEITDEYIANLPGNKLALHYSPDVVVICLAPVDVALERLGARSDKRDNAIFEERARLTKIAERFEEGEWKQYFTARGTRFIYFKADQSIIGAITNAQKLLQDLL